MASIVEILLTSAMTGGFTLGAMALTQRYQRDEKRTERAEAHKDLLRQKAEQIYLELEVAQDSGLKAALAAARELFTGEGFDDNDVVSGRLDKVKSLLHMYFPGADDILNRFDQAIMQPLQNQSEAVDRLPSETIAAERLKKVRELKFAMYQESMIVTQRTIVELRKYMNAEVKRLLYHG